MAFVCEVDIFLIADYLVFQGVVIGSLAMPDYKAIAGYLFRRLDHLY